jgi:hypothetical protein
MSYADFASEVIATLEHGFESPAPSA